MAVHEYTKPHKLSLLHDELLAAGIAVERLEGLGETIWVTTPAARNVVTPVVTAHDASILSAAEKVEEERSQAAQDLAGQFQAMMSRLDQIIADGASYTATQVRDAVIDEARIQKRTLRLIRRLV